MLRLSTLFQDHAVLQRDKTLTVWGWAKPERVIHGTLDGVTVAARSGEDGKFVLRFPPHAASSVPLTMTILDACSGKKVEVRDLLFGEVWLAGGQSNMEYQLAAHPERLADARKMIADEPQIRLLTVKKCAEVSGRTTVTGKWQLPTAKNIRFWSSVGFFFAEKLYRELNIPVGIVSSNWGGTVAEAWCSREALLANDKTASLIAEYDLLVSDPAEWAYWIKNPQAPACDGIQRRLQELKANPPENKGFANHWHCCDFDDSSWKTCKLPTLWNALGFDSNGVVWFRRSMELPESWLKQELTLEIGAVDKHDITFFNGVEVGRTGSGVDDTVYSKRRSYSVPAELVTENRITLAIRNYSFIYDGGMSGPGKCMRIFPAGKPEEAIPLAGEWKYAIECDIGKTLSCFRWGRGNPNTPSILFDSMIRPLGGLALKGVIWYQGESNTVNAAEYEKLMTMLIEDWRRFFGEPLMPFLQVVLAGYHEMAEDDPASLWAVIRQAQVRAAETTGNFCASALDIGEVTDIHPRYKREVGERLAQAALVQCCGRKGNGGGPVLSGFSRKGNSLSLRFRNCRGGLFGEPDCFFLDGKPLKGRFEGSRIILTLPDQKGGLLRYAWADFPTRLFFNREGIPASSFCLQILDACDE